MTKTAADALKSLSGSQALGAVTTEHSAIFNGISVFLNREEGKRVTTRRQRKETVRPAAQHCLRLWMPQCTCNHVAKYCRDAYPDML